MAVVYKFFEKRFPKEIRTVFLPLATMIIVVQVTLIVLGPIGGIIGNWLSDGVYALYNVAGPLGVLIIGALTPLLVFFGMNNALYPVLFALFAQVGNDPLIIAGMLSANVAVGAACLAVGIKAKKAELKGVAISAGVTGLLGITEPGVYGVLFPLKKPLIGAMIGGGVGGFLAGLFHVAAYSIASPSFVSLVIFIPSDSTGMSNFYYAILVAVVSVLVAFAATWKLCKKEELQ
jgi:PTS system beta-glucosides-specific IIC component